MSDLYCRSQALRSVRRGRLRRRTTTGREVVEILVYLGAITHTMGSLVDPSYELIDPCPDIHALFIDFDRRFFHASLAGCEVKWSPRMTTCAGLCSYEGRGGLCSIRLSKPLLSLRPRKDLVETLLHEMIHAYLFVTVRDRDRDGHGEKFQYHMNRINSEAGTRITIYHSFHAEVANFKTHHWRCTGPCRERRPFFGWVKRASNRAPSKNDLWWNDHQASCGGTFEKVSEPADYGKKKTKSKEDSKSPNEGGGARKVGGVKPPNPKQPRIDNVFGGAGAALGGPTIGASRLLGGATVQGGGATLGGPSTGRSRLLDMFESTKKKMNDPPKDQRSAEVIEDDDCIEVIEDTTMTKVEKVKDQRSTMVDYDDDCIEVVAVMKDGQKRGGARGRRTGVWKYFCKHKCDEKCNDKENCGGGGTEDGSSMTDQNQQEESVEGSVVQSIPPDHQGYGKQKYDDSCARCRLFKSDHPGRTNTAETPATNDRRSPYLVVRRIPTTFDVTFAEWMMMPDDVVLAPDPNPQYEIIDISLGRVVAHSAPRQ